MWNDQNLQMLTTLWRDGYSYAKIAANIGCSRSAVCAKVQRIGLKRGHKLSGNIFRQSRGCRESATDDRRQV